jgi:REase_MTES_1575
VVIERYPHHPGARRLKPFTEQPNGPTRSEFEDHFLAFARKYGLPTPIVSARVKGYEVDVLFLETRVIVELDGWTYHSSRRSFERDRERDTVLLAAGYVTVRITWERLTTQPEREAARLKAVLESRAGHGLS